MKNQTLLEVLMQGRTIDEQLASGAKAIKVIGIKKQAPFRVEEVNGITFVRLYNREKSS